MVELIFALFWNGFMAIFTCMMVMTDISTRQYPEYGEESIPIFVYLIIGLFWIIGIFLLIKGTKKVIRDRNTKIYGEECCGKIIRVYPSGVRVNGTPELKADVLVYIYSENRTETFSETIGFYPGDYSLGAYVKGKYYNGDINFKEECSESMIPFYIKEKIDSEVTSSLKINNELENNLVNTKNNDEIIINGIKYRKVDE